MARTLAAVVVLVLALASGAHADPGDTCSTHTDCVVSSEYASTNPYASSEEYCYDAGTHGGVTYGACSDCTTCSTYNNAIDGSCPSKCENASVSSSTECLFEIGMESFMGRKCWDRCPPLHNKGDNWCSMYPGAQAVCCGDDCCKPNGGAIAGVVIGAVIGVTLLIVSCCYCGQCGCFRYRRDQLIAAAAATRPQQPQVVYVQQAPAKVVAAV